MSDDSDQLAIRRVLVALDAASFGVAAVETAARLAAGLRAELRGLFVEDTNLLRLAALPFAQEIGYSSGAPRRLELPAVERLMRNKAEERQRTLSLVARQVGIQWSFEMARGRVVETTLAATSECDLLVFFRQATASSSALAALQRRLVVRYDASPVTRRALTLAALLAREHANEILALIAAESPELEDRLRREASTILKQQGIVAAHFQGIGVGIEPVAKAGRQTNQTLLLGHPNATLSDSAVDELVRVLACPLVLIR